MVTVQVYREQKFFELSPECPGKHGLYNNSHFLFVYLLTNFRIFLRKCL